MLNVLVKWASFEFLNPFKFSILQIYIFYQHFKRFYINCICVITEWSRTRNIPTNTNVFATFIKILCFSWKSLWLSLADDIPSLTNHTPRFLQLEIPSEWISRVMLVALFRKCRMYQRHCVVSCQLDTWKEMMRDDFDVVMLWWRQ